MQKNTEHKMPLNLAYDNIDITSLGALVVLFLTPTPLCVHTNDANKRMTHLAQILLMLWIG